MPNDTIPELSTDETILNNIGEGNEPTETPTPTTTETPAETPQEVSGGQSTDISPTGEPENTQTRGPQDLLDVNGQVIAAGGRERRFYESGQKFKHEAETSRSRIGELETQLEAINKAGNLGTQYNLTPEQLSSGAQMIKAYLENPVETVKYLLTQAQALGHNIDGISSGADMSAIKQMIDEAVAPLTTAQQEQSDTQERLAEANKIYETFTATYPDAVVHDKTLAQLLDKEPSLSPEAAYFKLKTFYLENKLDWSKPLDVIQKAQAAETPNVNTQSTIPSGGNVPTENVTDTAQVADVGTSYDDIIRESMKDANLTT